MSRRLPHETVTIRTQRRGRSIQVEAATIPGVPLLRARTQAQFASAVLGEVIRRSPTTRQLHIRFPDRTTSVTHLRLGA